jgi:NAD(P)-dependent dehydrogenase (short-subunit alcohol dehydrogenase family)
MANDTTTVLITGANRGIGLQFAEQFSRRPDTRVIGTARDPEGSAEDLRSLDVRVERLDVSDAASARALAETIGAEEPIDILINNAAVGPDGETIGELDMERLERALATNSVGPLRVTQALLPNLRKGSRKTVVQITSVLGSLTKYGGDRYYAYDASKAALNMLNRVLASDLKDEGFTCVGIHPGWVRTRMGGENAAVTPKDSVRAMIETIDGLTAERSGAFIDRHGEAIPW